MPSLLIVGKKEGAELALSDDVTVIGRDRGVGLELSDFQVSRRHALVIRTDDGCFVKDLGSRNGVLVNQAKVPTRRSQKLKNGDVVTLGKTSIIFKDVEIVLPAPPQDAQAGVETPATPIVRKEPEAKVETKKPEPKKPSERVEKKPDAEAKKPEPEAKKPEAKKPEAKKPEGKKDEPKKDDVKLTRAENVNRDGAEPSSKPANDALAEGRKPSPRFQELAADDVDAPAPGAPTSDRVALRDLLRKAERERVLYRNLVLGLVGFLVLVVVALLFYALGRHEAHGQEAPPQSARKTDPEKDPRDRPAVSRVGTTPVAVPLGKPGELDARAFAASVSPVLVKTCATSGCHDAPGAGDFLLVASSEPGAVEKNFAAARRYVVPGRPERSLLLTKPLRKDEGGEDHGGGDVLAAASPAYNALRAWVAAAVPAPLPEEERPRPRPAFSGTESETPSPNPMGSTPTTKPVHVPEGKNVGGPKVAGKVGTSVPLDATVTDSAGCEVSYRWTLIDRPEGSKVEVTGATTAHASLDPDVAGTYLVALVVKCESGSSEPFRVEVEIAKDAAQAPRVPGSVSRGARLRDEANGRLYVREVYLDLLGRGPRPEEAEQALDQSREDFVGDLFKRDELYVEWYEQQLLFFLLIDNFRPADDVNDIAQRLKAKELTVRDAIQAIVVGQYFNQRNPGNDTFVTVVLEQLHGVKVQDKEGKKLLDAGKKMYDGYPAKLFGKNGKNQADVVKIVVKERAFLEHLVGREHKRVTGSQIHKDELAIAVNKLEKDDSPSSGFFDLVKTWVLGQRYLDRVNLLRAKTERAFIRTLFLDLLERIPDEEELRNARNALRALADTGPLKAVLAKVILDSPKAKVSLGGGNDDFVKRAFVRFLARDPKPTELSTFKGALDAGTSRETVVRVLVTSPEYEGY